MKSYYDKDGIKIINDDCLNALKQIKSESIDAVVTDPPAGISFMGKSWDDDRGGRDDWIAWMQEIMTECNRVLKPGAHVIVWALPRTSHWTARAIEDAGFQIRDVLNHIFASGFPKSQNIGVVYDKKIGNEREKFGRNPNSRENCDKSNTLYESGTVGKTDIITKGTSKWEGFGTNLKPAYEHWILARKPLSEKTIVDNCIKHGTSALDIAGTRIPCTTEKDLKEAQSSRPSKTSNKNDYTLHSGGMEGMDRSDRSYIQGRFPANLLVTDDALNDGEMTKSGKAIRGKLKVSHFGQKAKPLDDLGYADTGSKSRYFDIDAWWSKFIKTDKGKEIEKKWQGFDKAHGMDLDTGWLIDLLRETLRDVLGKQADMINYDVWAEKHGLVQVPKASKAERNAGLEEGTGSNTYNKKCLNCGKWQRKQGLTDDYTCHCENPNWEKPKGNNHPTCKPVHLMFWLVRLVSKEGDIVLDPFMGSGTTGIACKMLGRKFIGIEMDKSYVEIGKARIEAVKPPQPTLFNL